LHPYLASQPPSTASTRHQDQLGAGRGLLVPEGDPDVDELVDSLNTDPDELTARRPD
jgi:hypothetical protein